MTMEIREYIRYFLTPGTEIDSAVIESVGVRASGVALTGAFAVAVESRFQESPSREEIAALVARIRERYIDPDGLPPMLGEALLRAAFGEEHLVKELSNEEWTRGQLLMTFGIVHDLGLEGEAYEEFLTEATKAAEEILEQAGHRPA
jgi:hypothetical protein